jgi:hypothetical protein
MAKELSIHQGELPEAPGLGRMDSQDPLRAGTYWRCKAEVTNDRNDEHRVVLVEVGEVRLLSEVRLVDGHPHTIFVAKHPAQIRAKNEWGDKWGDGFRILTGEFLKHFDPAWDGEQVREREIAEVTAEVERLRRELVEGPKEQMNQLLLQSPERAAEAILNRGTENPILARKTAETQVAIAERMGGWIQGKTDELSTAVARMGSYYTERAMVTVAQVSDTVAYADHLKKGIKNLQLYSGEEVTVETLCEGEGAPPSEPLTLFQRRLYMDEEYIVHVETGGADWKNLKDFARQLRKDPRLLERVLPTPRCVVAMRYRRKDKLYIEGSTAAEAYYNFELNKANRETFLLVRDGRNVYRVYSEIPTDDATSLFPTEDEMKKPFRGYGFRDEGDEITLDDVRYTDSLREFHAKLLHYKRLLILLWGLNDRLGLFGKFYDPGQYRGSFMDMEFQAQRFRFVHDEENVITDGRPSYSDWVDQMNSLAQPGSRILCIWKNLLTPDTAPGCVRESRNGRDYERNWDHLYAPKEKWEVKIARKQGTDLVVDAEVRGVRWNNDTKTKTSPVNLSKYSDYDLGWLCLDGMDPADIEYYLNSRQQRAGYLSYVPAFSMALTYLLEETRHEAPMLEEIRTALAHPFPAADTAKAAAEALRMWRASNRGRRPPAPTDPDFLDEAHAIMNTAHAIIRGPEDLMRASEATAEAIGRVPLRLVVTGKDRLALYATRKSQELGEQDLELPWVARIPMERQRDGSLRPGEPRFMDLPKGLVAERELWSWDGAGEWKDPRGIGGELRLQPSQWESLRRRLEGWRGHWEGLTAPVEDEAAAKALIQHYREVRWEMSKKFVNEPSIKVPVAIVASVPDRKEPGPIKASVICASWELAAAVHSRLPKKWRSSLRDAIIGSYRNKIHGSEIADAMEALRPTLRSYSIIEVAAEFGKPYCGSMHQRDPEKQPEPRTVAEAVRELIGERAAEAKKWNYRTYAKWKLVYMAEGAADWRP